MSKSAYNEDDEGPAVSGEECQTPSTPESAGEDPESDRYSRESSNVTKTKTASTRRPRSIPWYCRDQRSLPPHGCKRVCAGNIWGCSVSAKCILDPNTSMPTNYTICEDCAKLKHAKFCFFSCCMHNLLVLCSDCKKAWCPKHAGFNLKRTKLCFPCGSKREEAAWSARHARTASSSSSSNATSSSNCADCTTNEYARENKIRQADEIAVRTAAKKARMMNDCKRAAVMRIYGADAVILVTSKDD